MRPEHPDPRLFERFLRDETSPAENRAVVRNLLRGCPRCESEARVIWYLKEAPRARLDLGRESG